ncbi:MAG: potassium-transporting ATPase subunit KdpC [Gemmatimonadota bacterium]
MKLLSRQWRPAITLTLVLCIMAGVIYPAVVTILAQILFPRQANGSITVINGKPRGSDLLAQGFTSDRYFHPRPSAAGAGYDPTTTAGTNKGPTDRKLADTLVANSVREAVELDRAIRGQIPADMVTRSGSGLDPHISPANAALQVSRIARARDLSEAQVRSLVSSQTEGRQFGILGEPRVNVLKLNLALDRLAQ